MEISLNYPMHWGDDNQRIHIYLQTLASSARTLFLRVAALLSVLLELHLTRRSIAVLSTSRLSNLICLK
jgi:hypothetical protein